MIGRLRPWLRQSPHGDRSNRGNSVIPAIVFPCVKPSSKGMPSRNDHLVQTALFGAWAERPGVYCLPSAWPHYVCAVAPAELRTFIGLPISMAKRERAVLCSVAFLGVLFQQCIEQGFRAPEIRLP